MLAEYSYFCIVIDGEKDSNFLKRTTKESIKCGIEIIYKYGGKDGQRQMDKTEKGKTIL